MNQHRVSDGPYLCSVTSDWLIYQSGDGIAPNTIPGNPIELIFDQPGQTAQLWYLLDNAGDGLTWNRDNEWAPTINIPNKQFKMTFWDNDPGGGQTSNSALLKVSLTWEPQLVVPAITSVNLPFVMQIVIGGTPVISPQLLIVLTNTF